MLLLSLVILRTPWTRHPSSLENSGTIHPLLPLDLVVPHPSSPPLVGNAPAGTRHPPPHPPASLRLPSFHPWEDPHHLSTQVSYKPSPSNGKWKPAIDPGRLRPSMPFCQVRGTPSSHLPLRTFPSGHQDGNCWPLPRPWDKRQDLTWQFQWKNWGMSMM